MYVYNNLLTFYFQFLCIKSYLGLAQFVLVIRVFEKKRISSRVHIVDHEVLKKSTPNFARVKTSQDPNDHFVQRSRADSIHSDPKR